MSGSGGGFGGGSPAPSPNCESLVIDTQISSPNEAIILALLREDWHAIRLDVALQSRAAHTVVVILYNNEVIGGVASPSVQRLRECLEGGTEYQAEIISIEEGQARIRIRARRD